MCQVLFMGVGNIHAVRKSWDALEALCFDRDAANSANFGAQVLKSMKDAAMCGCGGARL